MLRGFRFIVTIVNGLIMGAVLVACAAIVLVAFVFLTEGSAGVPGIISIWATTENNATAVNVTPNVPGMGIAVLVITVVYITVVHAASRSIFGQRRAPRLRH
jgi:hypothetical protein